MAKKIGNTFNDLLAELNKDPDFRKEYRILGPRHELLKEIYDRRKELEWTQTKLAEEANTHQANISRIESGELDPRLSTIVELAEAMGTRVEIRLVPHFDDVEDSQYEQLFRVSAEVKTVQERVGKASYSSSPVKV